MGFVAKIDKCVSITPYVAGPIIKVGVICIKDDQLLKQLKSRLLEIKSTGNYSLVSIETDITVKLIRKVDNREVSLILKGDHLTVQLPLEITYGSLFSELKIPLDLSDIKEEIL